MDCVRSSRGVDPRSPGPDIGAPAVVELCEAMTHEGCESNNPDLPVSSRGPQMYICERILVVITEDWFALSHFRPLLCELRNVAKEVVVVARSSGRLDELQALGVRVRSLDLGRGSFNPLALSKVIWGLSQVIAQERPDAVHAIALQPMVLVSLALNLTRHRPRAVLLHLTGLGYLAVSRSLRIHVTRWVTMRAIRHSRSASRVWILAENEADIGYLLEMGIGRRDRGTLVPGAGVDAAAMPTLAAKPAIVPSAAFVGRMVHSKGVETLVEAHRCLLAQGTRLSLDLYGAADSDNPEAIPSETLAQWGSLPWITWHGHVKDISAVWRSADIAVVPSLGGEGMPKAMLEAAACGRPLIVSDVPGCRHFVRDGREGLVVPPGDVLALAAALSRLAGEVDLRRGLGLAARERVLAGFTTEIVRRAVRKAYQDALRA